MANLTQNTVEWSSVYLIEMLDKVLGGDGVGDIDNKQAHGLMKRDNYLKQELEKQGVDLALAMRGNQYTINDLIVLRGCDVTANIPGTSSITAGAILYNGRLYNVLANASISSPSNTLVFRINTTSEPYYIELVNGASGSGIANYNASSVKPLNIYTTTITDVLASNSYTSSSIDMTITGLEAYNNNNIMVLNLSVSVVFKVDTGGADSLAEIQLNAAYKATNTLSRTFPITIHQSSDDSLAHIRNATIEIVASGSNKLLRFIGSGTNSGGTYNRKSSFNISIAYKF